MILIVTNRQDYTADFLIIELRKRRAEYIRFNTDEFPEHIQVKWKIDAAGLSGYFSFPKRKVDFSEIRSIWYRRPVPPVPSADIHDPVAYEFAKAESQEVLDGIWRCLDCFWVSHPDKLRAAEYKLYQLKVASQLGFRLPPTLLTNEPETAKVFYNRNDIVAYKPLRRGHLVRGDEVSLIYTNRLGDKEARELGKVQFAPSLFQRYIPKAYDIRVTVIGSKVFAVAIESQGRAESIHDWRRGDVSKLPHRLHTLPLEVENKCISLVHTLGLAFGAIDLILTPDGEYIFLEINPNGQWAWIQQLHSEIPLREGLADLLLQGTECHK